MPVLIMMDLPGATIELYEAVNDQMNIRSAEDLPDGCLAHAAGQTEDGIVIVDVWESPEAFARFGQERLGPVAEQLNVPHFEPRVIPVHNRIPAGQGTRSGVLGIFETPLTPGQYDEMIAKMPAHIGDGSSHPAVSHTAGVENGTVIVVDVWDSPESFQEFSSQITSALGGELLPMQAKFVPIHSHLRAPASVRRS